MSALDGVAARAAAAAQVFVSDVDDPRLDDGQSRHLSRALRLRSGEAVVASDGAGRWRICRFVATRAVDDSGPVLEPDGPVAQEPRPVPTCVVAFAPAKGDRPEWVVQKLTEIGIDRIVPLVTERSVVRWDGERGEKAHVRLRRVAVEAAAQSRSVWLPEVTPAVGLVKLAGDIGDSALALAQIGGRPMRPDQWAIAIGPEGGWAPSELERGFATVGLGTHVLRAETAAVVAATFLVARRENAVLQGGGDVTGPTDRGRGEEKRQR